MSITYSLDALLLDDPELDHESLLGPVERMRWMSNLLRLAVLEEIDQLHAAAGEYTEHEAEIRRLRRSSMAPDAGRYYCVEGKANRIFKNLDPEQAAQIVDHWRSCQPIPLGVDHEDDPEDFDEGDAQCDLPEECSEVEYPDAEYDNVEGPYSDQPNAAESESSDAERNTEHQTPNTDLSTLNPEPRTRNSGEAARSFSIPSWPQLETPNTKNQTLSCRTKHQTQNTKPKTRANNPQTRLSRIARIATDVAIALLAALLVVSAIWFIKTRTRPASPHPPPPGTAGPFEANTAKEPPPHSKHETQDTKHPNWRHTDRHQTDKTPADRGHGAVPADRNKVGPAKIRLLPLDPKHETPNTKHKTRQIKPGRVNATGPPIAVPP